MYSDFISYWYTFFKNSLVIWFETHLLIWDTCNCVSNTHNPSKIPTDYYILYESPTYWSIQNTLFDYKKTPKIASIVISIEERFISFLTIWFDNQIGVLIVKKNLQIKYHAIIYTIFISKIVRKSVLNRDFAKFHSTPKN